MTSKPAAKSAEAKPASSTVKAKAETTTAKPKTAKAPAKPAAKAPAEKTAAAKAPAKPAAKAAAPAKAAAKVPAKASSGPSAGVKAPAKSTTKPAASAEPAAKPVAAKASAKPASRTTGVSNRLAAPRGNRPDNLTRIKGIGTVNEKKLNEHGIFHFDQIAAWKKADVVAAEAYLAFDGRIAREEWVKQAALLAKGKETEFSKRVDAGKVATSHASRKAAAPKKTSAKSGERK